MRHTQPQRQPQHEPQPERRPRPDGTPRERHRQQPESEVDVTGALIWLEALRRFAAHGAAGGETYTPVECCEHIMRLVDRAIDWLDPTHAA